MIRKAVVAGQFYTGSKNALLKELSVLAPEKKEKLDALGIVSPHAGYMYSGKVAGDILSSVKPRSSYVILGPNHTGFGKPFGLDPERNWETPLGEARADKDLGNEILRSSKYVEKDALSHNHEHSIEVQLPFLQYLNKDFTFVPIVVSYGDKSAYMNIGKELAAAIKKTKKETMIIASSDMTHYEPYESAKKKDMMAIDKILKLDVPGFLDTVQKEDISMCGFAPAAIMLAACIELGAKKAKLLMYNTSGDASGDYSSVVGYAGIAVY